MFCLSALVKRYPGR